YSAGWHSANPARIAAGDGNRDRPGYLSGAERLRRSDSGAAVRLIRAENWDELWAVSVLQARKPATVFEPRRAKQRAWLWAMGWAELLAVLWAESE
ncbi:hypothetical protein, partial [uncultured Rikenella sp.]|uniref:hypothetical protein n=1 Tax=uncultured Rikenella sp. TaxID=368003 RepID=UPI002729B002